MKVETKYVLGAVVVLALVIGAYLCGGGCSLNPPIPPVPPVVIVPPDPDPEPIATRHLILFRESADANLAMNLLVTSLQGGTLKKYLDDHGHKLIGIVDPHLPNAEGSESRIVAKYKSALTGQKLPVLLVLDTAGNVLHKHSLPADAGDSQIIAILSQNGEEAFSSLPWVDCDFSQQKEFVAGDTTEVDTFENENARQEPKFGQADGEQVFEDAIPLIPRSEWPNAIAKIDAAGGSLDLLRTRIYNQGREGSCTSNATSQAHELVQAMQWGKHNVIHLSAISLYKQVGGSPSSGSSVSGNMAALLKVGVLPLDDEANRAKGFKHVFPATGFYTKYPQDWQQTAKLFRCHEIFDVRSFDGFITALIRGYPVVYGRDGHAICAVRPLYRNGKLYVKYANSWGDWGDNGYGYDSEATVKRGANWAFAVRSNVDSELSVRLPALEDSSNEQSFALAP